MLGEERTCSETWCDYYSQGDSTLLEVDSIVNAANGSLLGQFIAEHCSGLPQ